VQKNIPPSALARDGRFNRITTEEIDTIAADAAADRAVRQTELVAR
jgi:hypothetical protein